VFQQQQQEMLHLKAAKDHAENQCDYIQQQYAGSSSSSSSSSSIIIANLIT
jgi:hypothetical protein